MNKRKLPPNLYERKYKTRGGYISTIYSARFTDWKGRRRSFPLGKDFQRAKVLLAEIDAKNRLKHDFDTERKFELLKRISTPLGGDVKTLDGLIGPNEFEFNGQQIRQLRQPVVYAWVEKDRVVYIGYSTMGAYRIFNPGHHRLSGMGKAHRLLIWTVPSTVDAQNLERHLIGELRPRYNSSGLLRNGGRKTTIVTDPASSIDQESEALPHDPLQDLQHSESSIRSS